MNPDWTHDTIAAVDVTLLSRYNEPFADHAVEITFNDQDHSDWQLTKCQEQIDPPFI